MIWNHTIGKYFFISLKLTKNVYIWIITVMHVYMFSMIKDLTQSAFLIFFSKVIGTKNLVFIRLTVVS